MWTDRALRLLLVLQTLPALFVGCLAIDSTTPVLTDGKVYSIQGIYNGHMIPVANEWKLSTVTGTPELRRQGIQEVDGIHMLWDYENDRQMGIVMNSTDDHPQVVHSANAEIVVAILAEVTTTSQFFCVPEAGYLEDHPPNLITHFRKSLTRDCIGDQELQRGDGVQADTGEETCILEEKRLNDELSIIEDQRTTSCVVGKGPIEVTDCAPSGGVLYDFAFTEEHCYSTTRERGHKIMRFSGTLCHGLDSMDVLTVCSGTCACDLSRIVDLRNIPANESPPTTSTSTSSTSSEIPTTTADSSAATSLSEITLHSAPTALIVIYALATIFEIQN